MTRIALVSLAALLAIGCQQELVVPPVSPAPEDLSTWSVPEMIQPPAPLETPTPGAEPKPAPGERIITWAPGATSTAHVALGWPLDIVLQSGEAIRNIVGGDRAPVEAGQTPRWEVKQGAEGEGTTARPHLFLSATEPGLTLGLIITTTKRTYYLEAKSIAKSPVRVLRWRYPAEETPASEAHDTATILPRETAGAAYHVGYQLAFHGPAPEWLPRHIVDDGKKLYILYPERSLFGIVPLVRLVGVQGPQLVNTRQYLNVVIVDQLPARLELRVGTGDQAETVQITRGTLRTILCPGETECPVWPSAAQALQQRRRP